MTEIINLCGLCYNEADSYGIIAAQLVKHLSADGVHVNPFGLVSVDRGVQSDELKALLHKPIKPALGGIFLGWPTTFGGHPEIAQEGKRIAVTMFESTRLPTGWASILNEMDAVIVPSQFCAESFADSGVTAPIHVIPLGTGEAYAPVKRDATRKPMRFLAFMDRGRRKGGHIAIEAFLKAFGGNPDYRLVLKARNGPNRVELLPVGNIELIQDDMTEADLNKLYQSCDVMINPNCGEGFGMIPREFAATGGIALATDWGGTADDLELWGWPLPYELAPADWSGLADLEGQDLGEWALPCVDGVATCLQKASWIRDWMTERAYRKADYVSRLYSWKRFSEKVLEVWGQP